MKIAAIILNYNTSFDCRKCVSFLKKQQGVELEIIIVDNCSCEEDLAELRIQCKEQQCTLIENKENRGYNAGNNVGLRYTANKGYKYAMIANPDMEFPQQDYLARLIEKMEEDEQVVVVGGDIVSLEGIHQNPLKRDGNWRDCWSCVKGFLPWRGKDANNFYYYNENHYCAKVSGCCLLIRMDFVKSIGFFDENVFLYCEEPILSRQVELAGKKMYYLAGTQAIHAHVKSEKGDPIKRFKHLRNSRFYFIERYSGDTYIGQAIQKLSVQLNIGIYTLFLKLKK